jgi:segregation and condensation protein B
MPGAMAEDELSMDDLAALGEAGVPTLPEGVADALDEADVTALPADGAGGSAQEAEAGADGDSGADLFDPAAFTRGEKSALLVALLFAAGDILPVARLTEFFALSEEELIVLVEEAAGELRLRGLDILAAAGGYRLVTAAEWDEPLRRFHRQVRKAKLSRGALEILAIIAYEQPISRSRIDDMRQVNSESTVRTLLDRRLITVAGRADTPGRPFLYRTTAHFLEVFGLNALDELPPRPAALDLPAGEREEPFSIDALPDFSEDELEEG